METNTVRDFIMHRNGEEMKKEEKEDRPNGNENQITTFHCKKVSAMDLLGKICQTDTDMEKRTKYLVPLRNKIICHYDNPFEMHLYTVMDHGLDDLECDILELVIEIQIVKNTTIHQLRTKIVRTFQYEIKMLYRIVATNANSIIVCIDSNLKIEFFY